MLPVLGSPAVTMMHSGHVLSVSRSSCSIPRRIVATLAWIVALALCATSLVLFVGAESAYAQTEYDDAWGNGVSVDERSAESHVLVELNRIRRASGMAPVVVDDELRLAARRWSRDVAAVGYPVHAPSLTDGIQQPWRSLAENVGVGPSIESVVTAFAASPAHLANIVNPRFDRVGIAVRATNGQLVIVQRFRESRVARVGGQPSNRAKRRTVTHAKRRERPVPRPAR